MVELPSHQIFLFIVKFTMMQLNILIRIQLPAWLERSRRCFIKRTQRSFEKNCEAAVKRFLRDICQSVFFLNGKSF
ncbi:hypothetical protein WS75_15300 [Burkholderia sp. FL-7-2-10-S1-D7]|nr:hypothetical protein WS75_15300 [Burkholderia sp. FL-7-2-10-S1-D7]